MDARSQVRPEEEMAKVIDTTFDPLRYVMQASKQTQEYIAQAHSNLRQLDRICATIANLQTDLADAKTVIRAMAEADADQDTGAVQAMARTYLRRFEGVPSGESSP